MSAELFQFLTTHGTVVTLAVAVVAGIGVVQWRKARVAELELALQAELLSQGVAAADMEKLLAARAPARKGLLEQFGSLSGGAKAGLIIGSVLVVQMVMGAAMVVGARRGVPPHVPPQPAPAPQGTPEAGTDTTGTVYRAMRLTPLEVGAGTFKPGDSVPFRYGLTNTPDRDLRPPLNKDYSTPMYLVGTRQHWVERLGTDADIEVIPTRIAREGRRYAAGGQVIEASSRIPGGRTLSFRSALDTKGFPPGKYRYTVEYRELHGQVLQSEAVGFELAR